LIQSVGLSTTAKPLEKLQEHGIIQIMKIEWDPRKAELNLKKHGLHSKKLQLL
jgi:hypothetical protein